MFDYMLMALAFGLFLLYDGNQIYWHKRYLQPAFFLGCLLLILPLITTMLHRDIQRLSYLFLTFAALCLILEVYVLFFALPFQETYGKDAAPEICRTGVYGVCRHPGFWTLSACFLFLALAFPFQHMWLLTSCATGINFLYILFQDVFSFPRLFLDYGEYKRDVPFLIPHIVRRKAEKRMRR